MFPGMNPKKMQQMMKQMGIQQSEMPAREVIIRMDDKEIIIKNPSVSKVNMMGQETFQISGEIEERSLETRPEINEDDVKTVMDQANVSKEEARKAIEESKGDLAEAIMKITESKEE
jgi:nascent polypeptide-associated complex subunit alpha